MRRRDDGGPAFPTLYLNGSDGSQFQSTDGGMTLRDYFAAQLASGMMAGLLADGSHCEMEQADTHARIFYAFADAMLKERAK